MMSKILQFLKRWATSAAVAAVLVLMAAVVLSVIKLSLPLYNPVFWWLLQLSLSIGYIFACILTLFDIFEGL